MKKLLFIICLMVVPIVAHASGPGLPDGYRMPNKEELSLSIRCTDKNLYATIAGDFNGDGLIDGAILSIDKNYKELVVFAFICTGNSQAYKWYKVESLEYGNVKYTGLKRLKPQTILYYHNIKSEAKTELILDNDAFELFQFEGSSSVFYYEEHSDQFKRVWISK